jgi:hypothetical protein
MTFPRNYLSPDRRGRVSPTCTLEAIFTFGRNGGVKAIMVRRKKMAFISRYLLQNRSKDHKQLINEREKLDLNSVHVRYDVKAVVWPKNRTKR